MSDPKTATLAELLPNPSVAGRVAAVLARFGLGRRRLSRSGQPIPRLARRQLALYDVSFDAVFVICENGKVRGANATPSSMFGGSLAAFEGLSAATFFRSPEATEETTTFDPVRYLEATRVTALGLDCRSFPAELRSAEIELNGAHCYVLHAREILR
jgi:PAS domain-containing protein